MLLSPSLRGPTAPHPASALCLGPDLAQPGSWLHNGWGSRAAPTSSFPGGSNTWKLSCHPSSGRASTEGSQPPSPGQTPPPPRSAQLPAHSRARRGLTSAGPLTPTEGGSWLVPVQMSPQVSWLVLCGPKQSVWLPRPPHTQEQLCLVATFGLRVQKAVPATPLAEALHGHLLLLHALRGEQGGLVGVPMAGRRGLRETLVGPRFEEVLGAGVGVRVVLVRQRQRLALREFLGHAGDHVRRLPVAHVPDQFLELLLVLLPPLEELSHLRLGQPQVPVACERVAGRQQALQDVWDLLVAAVVWRGWGQEGLLQCGGGVVLLRALREAGELLRLRDREAHRGGRAVAARGHPGLLREEVGVQVHLVIASGRIPGGEGEEGLAACRKQPGRGVAMAWLSLAWPGLSPGSRTEGAHPSPDSLHSGSSARTLPAQLYLWASALSALSCLERGLCP